MILFFDTETTGLNRSTARIVQLAWILSNHEGGEISRASMIIKPKGYSIPESASAIHNITTEFALENGISLKSCLKQMAELADEVRLLVAHNISYDSAIIKEEFHRAGLKYPFGKTPVVCTMKSSTDYCGLEKKTDAPGYKWPKLEELYRHLFGYDFLDAHDALADAEACKRCYFELVEREVISLDYDWVPSNTSCSTVADEDHIETGDDEDIEVDDEAEEDSANEVASSKSLQRKVARKEKRISDLRLREKFLKDEVARLKSELREAKKERGKVAPVKTSDAKKKAEARPQAECTVGNDVSAPKRAKKPSKTESPEQTDTPVFLEEHQTKSSATILTYCSRCGRGSLVIMHPSLSHTCAHCGFNEGANAKVIAHKALLKSPEKKVEAKPDDDLEYESEEECEDSEETTEEECVEPENPNECPFCGNDVTQYYDKAVCFSCSKKFYRGEGKAPLSGIKSCALKRWHYYDKTGMLNDSKLDQWYHPADYVRYSDGFLVKEGGRSEAYVNSEDIEYLTSYESYVMDYPSVPKNRFFD